MIALLGHALGGKGTVAAARMQADAYQRAVDEQQRQFAAIIPSPARDAWDPSRLDFWNDPDRWDGIDPHVECFWMRRRKDVILVAEPAYIVAGNPYTNVAQGQFYSRKMLQSQYNAA